MRLKLPGISRLTRHTPPFAWVRDRHGYILPMLYGHW